MDPMEYLRARDIEEPLPWDHIKVGPSKDFLLLQREKSRKGLLTPDCRMGVWDAEFVVVIYGQRWLDHIL